MTKHPSDTDTRTLAALALTLDEGAPKGPPPELVEIERWRHGELPQARAAEVRAHLARDPALFAQLVELESAADLAQQLGATGSQGRANPSVGLIARLRAWHGPWLWGGGLVAAALLAGVGVLVPPLLPKPPGGPDVAYAPASPGLRSGLERDLARLGRDGGHRELEPATPGQASSPFPEVDHSAARQAFREGMRLARLEADGRDAWALKHLDLAPAHLSTCPSGDSACRARRNAYLRLGRWAWDLDASCAGGGADEPDWNAAASALGQLAQDLAADTDEDLAAVLAEAAEADDPSSLCEVASRLLVIGSDE